MINPIYSSPDKFSDIYKSNKPYPHIVFDDFLEEDFANEILGEFPDLSKINSKIVFDNEKEVKYASIGFADISPSATKLISYLNSDIFLKFLQGLTGIKEVLLSDPYLAGVGYHEIKKGGVLKVHADFNKHPDINLDRRLNILIYLNRSWKEEWGGNLELYTYGNFEKPYKSIMPLFNRCVIFSTTSFTYHGHPDRLKCPSKISRKSIALYYYTLGRPKSETKKSHSTIFVKTKGENWKYNFSIKQKLKEFLPEKLKSLIKKIL